MDINEETLDHYLEKLILTQTLRQYLLLCLSKKKKRERKLVLVFKKIFLRKYIYSISSVFI